MKNYLYSIGAIANVEIHKLARDPTEILSRAIQPILWLTIFGQVFSQVRGIPTGSLGYLDYMAPGILAQSILFSSIFYGIAVIWERDLGIVHKLLVTPAPRSSLVLGKATGAGIRGLLQALLVYLIATVLGIHISWTPDAILLVLTSVFLGACIFSTFSLFIACVVKTRERFMGIGQVLTMPLFFASNAIYPMELMPPWLRTIASFNPLTYLVDALRGEMVIGGTSHFALSLSFGIMLLVFTILTAATAKIYPSLAH